MTGDALATIPDATIWTVIVAMGIGAFALRYSFLGFFADRDMPVWLLRPLRYGAVAVLPGLVAPLVLWPDISSGGVEVERIAAATVTLAAGILSRNVVIAMLSGAVTFYGLTALLG